MLCYAVARKIPIKGVTTFQPCPADKPLLAAFIAEAKGQPAVATVLDHSGEQPVTISRKSFYRATGTMCWAPAAGACAIQGAQLGVLGQSPFTATSSAKEAGCVRLCCSLCGSNNASPCLTVLSRVEW